MNRLISYLFASDVVVYVEILGMIKMKKNKKAFSARSGATQYLEQV